MPESGPDLPSVMMAVGAVAWRLPAAAMRRMEMHAHSEGQLCGLDSGLAILEAESGSWLCPPGRCVWIPGGVRHALRSCGRIGGWMVHVRAVDGEELPAEPRVLSLTPLLRELVSRMTEWREAPEESASRRRLVQVLLDEVVGAAPLELHLPAPRTLSLQRVAARLAEVGAEAPGLGELAREVGLSERSLFRDFQRETGLSPGRWRRQMQVLRGTELLAEGRAVTETALEVGYESTGAFTRAFREVMRMTPTAYARGQQRAG